MIASDRELHERPNGVWSLRMAELNKRLFFNAYVSRIDEVAHKRAIMEAESFLARNADTPKEGESKLLIAWKKNPPSTKKEWQRWIAIHQQHLFLSDDLRGGFLRSFPALKKSEQKADIELTRLFYEALRQFSF
ncbi:MAG: hypothetical protein HWD92_12970 [Flavobacteriia bacterium]|nr:hypothetical protein [Flavobacteriia bacterium]